MSIEPSHGTLCSNINDRIKPLSKTCTPAAACILNDTQFIKTNIGCRNENDMHTLEVRDTNESITDLASEYFCVVLADAFNSRKSTHS